MTLNDVKDQIVERLKEIATRISESEAYIQLAERFSNLSPLVQKVIIGAAVFTVGFLLYTIPASYLDAAAESSEAFRTDRLLLRNLYRTARFPILSPDRFAGQDFDGMKSQVDAVLSKTQVLDSQKGAFSPANKPLSESRVPRGISQKGMEFEIKKLNLKQVVALSEQVSVLHPNTKLASIDIQADEKDPHYFNVKYTLSSLSVPIKQASPGGAKPNFKKK